MPDGEIIFTIGLILVIAVGSILMRRVRPEAPRGLTNVEPKPWPLPWDDEDELPIDAKVVISERAYTTVANYNHTRSIEDLLQKMLPDADVLDSELETVRVLAREWRVRMQERIETRTV